MRHGACPGPTAHKTPTSSVGITVSKRQGDAHTHTAATCKSTSTHTHARTLLDALRVRADTSLLLLVEYTAWLVAYGSLTTLSCQRH